MSQRHTSGIVKPVFTIGATILIAESIFPRKIYASESKKLKQKLLERIQNGAFDSYHPGITTPDIYYPPWFSGIWLANSLFTKVEAPLGEAAFGGPGVLETVRRDLNTTLRYKTRFKKQTDGKIIADRLYNVEQIALASMGSESIIDDAQMSNDLASEIQLIIAPPTSGGALFEVVLRCSDREQQEITPRVFESLERTSQTISVRVSDPPRPLQKEVETITIYTQVDENTVTAIQRTATFLSPMDPRYVVAKDIEPRIANMAVDLREYVVSYTRI